MSGMIGVMDVVVCVVGDVVMDYEVDVGDVEIVGGDVGCY